MQFSTAEISAMVLDGERVLLGDSSIHAASFATSFDRVATLRLALPGTHVIGGRAAAWIHGCAAEPQQIDVLINRSVRPARLNSPRVRIRRAKMHIQRDTVLLGRYRVLTAERTANDLELGDPAADDLRSAELLRDGFSLL